MIARTIMPLARHLGLEVVAEGVETVEQAMLLKELRCKYAQGFLFSRPLAADDVQTMLATAAGPAQASVPFAADQVVAPYLQTEPPQSQAGDHELASANVEDP